MPEKEEKIEDYIGIGETDYPHDKPLTKDQLAQIAGQIQLRMTAPETIITKPRKNGGSIIIHS